jgi:hypothetical protein
MRTTAAFRTLFLLSPLLLWGCSTIDLSAIDLPTITLPWADAAPAPTVTARADAAEVPAGLQVDDLRMPFGAPVQTASTDTSRTPPRR